MVVYDRFGRPVRGVRISLNSSYHCNFDCIFCHKEGIPHTTECMSSEEIIRIIRVLTRFGIEYVKLTGGEPMLRDDIVEIVRGIKMLGIKELSMTTNGTRLPQLAYELKNRGLDRVNISLHSLKRDRFRFITKRDMLDNTLRAVEESIEAGLKPVKLNVVLLKNVNDDEIEDLIEYSYSLGGGETNVLQIIELLKVDPSFYEKYHVDLDPIERAIAEKAVKVRYKRLQNRPIYYLSNGVQVEFVKPMYNHAFCMGNDRIRITHDGKFKPCLMRRDNHVDFLNAMRHGASDDDLATLYLKAVSLREPYFKEGEESRDKICVDTSSCII